MIKYSYLKLYKAKFGVIITWRDQVEDGKRKVKCVGNGNVRDLRKKSERES